MQVLSEDIWHNVISSKLIHMHTGLNCCYDKTPVFPLSIVRGSAEPLNAPSGVLTMSGDVEHLLDDQADGFVSL